MRSAVLCWARMVPHSRREIVARPLVSLLGGDGGRRAEFELTSFVLEGQYVRGAVAVVGSCDSVSSALVQDAGLSSSPLRGAGSLLREVELAR